MSTTMIPYSSQDPSKFAIVYAPVGDVGINDMVIANVGLGLASTFQPQWAKYRYATGNVETAYEEQKGLLYYDEAYKRNRIQWDFSKNKYVNFALDVYPLIGSFFTVDNDTRTYYISIRFGLNGTIGSSLSTRSITAYFGGKFSIPTTIRSGRISDNIGVPNYYTSVNYSTSMAISNATSDSLRIVFERPISTDRGICSIFNLKVLVSKSPIQEPLDYDVDSPLIGEFDQPIYINHTQNNDTGVNMTASYDGYAYYNGKESEHVTINATIVPNGIGQTYRVNYTNRVK